MEIKRASKSQIEDILIINRQSLDYHDEILNGLVVDLDEQKIYNWFEKYILDKNALFLVAVIDNKVVGYLVGEKLDKKARYKVREQFYIYEFAVDTRYRRKGIATNLYKEAIKVVKNELGLNEIELKVYDNNKIAMDFYKSLGLKKLFTHLYQEI